MLERNSSTTESFTRTSQDLSELENFLTKEINKFHEYLNEVKNAADAVAAIKFKNEDLLPSTAHRSLLQSPQMKEIYREVDRIERTIKTPIADLEKSIGMIHNLLNEIEQQRLLTLSLRSVLTHKIKATLDSYISFKMSPITTEQLELMDKLDKNPEEKLTKNEEKIRENLIKSFRVPHDKLKKLFGDILGSPISIKPNLNTKSFELNFDEEKIDAKSLKQLVDTANVVIQNTKSNSKCTILQDMPKSTLEPFSVTRAFIQNNTASAKHTLLQNSYKFKMDSYDVRHNISDFLQLNDLGTFISDHQLTIVPEQKHLFENTNDPTSNLDFTKKIRELRIEAETYVAQLEENHNTARSTKDACLEKIKEKKDSLLTVANNIVSKKAEKTHKLDTKLARLNDSTQVLSVNISQLEILLKERDDLLTKSLALPLKIKSFRELEQHSVSLKELDKKIQQKIANINEQENNGEKIITGITTEFTGMSQTTDAYQQRSALYERYLKTYTDKLQRANALIAQSNEKKSAKRIKVFNARHNAIKQIVETLETELKEMPELIDHHRQLNETIKAYSQTKATVESLNQINLEIKATCLELLTPTSLNKLQEQLIEANRLTGSLDEQHKHTQSLIDQFNATLENSSTEIKSTSNYKRMNARLNKVKGLFERSIVLSKNISVEIQQIQELQPLKTKLVKAQNLGNVMDSFIQSTAIAHIESEINEEKNYLSSENKPDTTLQHIQKSFDEANLQLEYFSDAEMKFCELRKSRVTLLEELSETYRKLPSEKRESKDYLSIKQNIEAQKNNFLENANVFSSKKNTLNKTIDSLKQLKEEKESKIINPLFDILVQLFNDDNIIKIWSKEVSYLGKARALYDGAQIETKEGKKAVPRGVYGARTALDKYTLNPTPENKAKAVKYACLAMKVRWNMDADNKNPSKHVIKSCLSMKSPLSTINEKINVHARKKPTTELYQMIVENFFPNGDNFDMSQENYNEFRTGLKKSILNIELGNVIPESPSSGQRTLSRTSSADE